MAAPMAILVLADAAGQRTELPWILGASVPAGLTVREMVLNNTPSYWEFHTLWGIVASAGEALRWRYKDWVGWQHGCFGELAGAYE